MCIQTVSSHLHFFLNLFCPTDTLDGKTRSFSQFREKSFSSLSTSSPLLSRCLLLFVKLHNRHLGEQRSAQLQPFCYLADFFEF